MKPDVKTSEIEHREIYEVLRAEVKKFIEFTSSTSESRSDMSESQKIPHAMKCFHQKSHTQNFMK